VEFRVLGPLEALDERRSIALGGAKQRGLMAMLLLARGRVVATDRLIDEIWAGDPPETARKSVQAYVSALRAVLGDERIVTREHGYAVVYAAEELDLDRFDALVAEAAGQPADRAADTLRRALALIRGAPVEDVVLGSWAQNEIRRIEERCLVVLESRIDADLESGRHRDVVPELESLLSDHPYREHLLEQLMLALYRSGRQADALAAYGRGAGRLRVELGLEAGRSIQDLEQRILRHDPSLDPPLAPVAPTIERSTPATRWVSRRSVLAIGAATVLIAAAFVAVATTRDSRTALMDLRPGVATIDEHSGRVLSSIGTNEISQPTGAVKGAGTFWIWSLDPFLLSRIDSKTGKILRRIASPFSGDAGWYLPDGASVWFVGTQDLVRVDTATGLEAGRYRLVQGAHTFGLTGIARGAGSLWIASHDESRLLRVDPATGRVVKTISIAYPWAVAYGNGAVWITSYPLGLVRVDPTTNAITAIAAVPQQVTNVAVGGGFAWATNEFKGTLYKVDQSGKIVATYPTGDGASGVSYADCKLWVVNQDAGSVTGVDAATGATRVFRFGHPLNSVAALGTRLAVVLNPGRTYEDRIAALKGDVARLIIPAYQLGPADPALADNPFAFQAERATCLSLLHYPDANPPAGLRLRPELATAMPVVTPDGRTYTFTVRTGDRFAPPSNASVTPASIRYGIERALSPRLGDYLPGMDYLSDLEGVRRYQSGGDRHISGIRISTRTISFTLTKASPDFLERLALPYFCPVPLTTPIVRGGLPDLPPPGAGPYTMTQRFNGEYLILTRNPNYHGTRPHVLDAIAFREGIDDETAVRRVEHRTWDGVSLYSDGGVLDPSGPVAARWGPRSPAAQPADQRYHATPVRQIHYLVLNARRPLFRSARVRRAVAAALDRSALARGWALTPSSHLLPPNVRGHQVARTARSTTAATTLPVTQAAPAVMAVRSDCPACHATAAAVVTALAHLGIKLEIREVADSGEALFKHAESFDIADWTTSLPYPDPASFLERLFLRDVPAQWLPAGTRASVETLGHLSGAARDAAANRLARRLETDETAIIAYGYPTIGTLLAPRLGCQLWTPGEAGIDLAPLCLRKS
jgi:DNA-binding SARP family transcriptional activator/ABC-type transport system substrate-binding protein